MIPNIQYIEILGLEQITKADRLPMSIPLQNEHSEFTNEMSYRAHKSLQVKNNGKA
jgi:hypothetical protein